MNRNILIQLNATFLQPLIFHPTLAHKDSLTFRNRAEVQEHFEMVAIGDYNMASC